MYKRQDLDESHERVLKVAKQVLLARKLERFTCAHENGCYACRPLEAIVRGEAELVGVNDYRQDMYVLRENRAADDEEVESMIL